VDKEKLMSTPHLLMDGGTIIIPNSGNATSGVEVGLKMDSTSQMIFEQLYTSKFLMAYRASAH
jgi:hypothetical protein